MTTREPGVRLGAEVDLNVDDRGNSRPLVMLTETLLFLAARQDHVERLIEPALADGPLGAL